MYARTCNNKIALEVVKAVCHAKARNFSAARMRAAFSVESVREACRAAFAGYLA